MPDRPLPPGSTIGILGGGQLGRMLAVAASRLGLKAHIYSDEAGVPAFDVSAAKTVGPYTDSEAVARFADAVDVVTCEFENVPAEALEAASRVAPVFPKGLTMLAVGGYGRRELFPYSDIDIMLLVDSEAQTAVLTGAHKEALSEFVRILWDAGLRLSHSVHTVADCLEVHEQNIELNISLLDGEENGRRIERVLNWPERGSFANIASGANTAVSVAWDPAPSPQGVNGTGSIFVVTTTDGLSHSSDDGTKWINAVAIDTPLGAAAFDLVAGLSGSSGGVRSFLATQVGGTNLVRTIDGGTFPRPIAATTRPRASAKEASMRRPSAPAQA